MTQVAVKCKIFSPHTPPSTASVMLAIQGDMDQLHELKRYINAMTISETSARYVSSLFFPVTSLQDPKRGTATADNTDLSVILANNMSATIKK